ncbi:hypothetical protein [Dongshaea marina]|uniref:hypothetical protein n=1 Tax=Dongshaea marina TaxID=2047966 RepID=UPI000D3E4127|nr:hypothetical protein [Dongshaea marina]
MKTDEPKGIWSYLLSRDARMTIILPIIIYNASFWLWSAGAALVLTALYSGVVELYAKERSSLSIVLLILVSGVCHYLYLHGYTLLGIRQESVFLSVSGALSVVVVFMFYSFIGRPFIRGLAEKSMPRLKTIPAYGTPAYSKVWRELSFLWIVIYLIKAVFIYQVSYHKGLPVELFVLLAGWPLTLAMVFFSFYWPKYRWSSIESINKS